MDSSPRAGGSRAAEGDYHQSLILIKSERDVYSLTESLGQGAFGKVYKGFAHHTTRHVAVKMFFSKNKSLPLKEYSICREFDGAPNIIQAYDMLEYQGRTCIAFEFMDQTLHEFISQSAPLTIKICHPIMKQLLEALKYLKMKGILHCDVKPVNIMTDHWTSDGRVVKLIDFGAAIYRTQVRQNALLQTRPYRAPEVIIGAPRDEKVDMWSLGCVLAEMLSGRRLYPAVSDRQQLSMITQCQGPLPQSLLMQGLYTNDLYKVLSSGGREYEFQLDTDPSASYSSRSYTKSQFQTTSLNQVTQYDTGASIDEKIQMLSLLKSMLVLDPELRCSPEVALDHTFFSMIGAFPAAESIPRRILSKSNLEYNPN